MDRAELIAKEWFEREGFSRITHEPFGPSTFPDFALGTDTLAEVTWLLQIDERNLRPLSESEAPFLKNFEKALGSIDRSERTCSYFVDVSFRKPLFKRANELADALKLALAGNDRNFDGRTRIYLKPNIWIEVYPASRDYGKAFLLGCSANYDAGGWVSDFIPKSVAAAVERKEATAKRTPLNRKFKRRMLVLVDGMGGSVDDYSQCEVELDFFTEVLVIGIQGELARWSA